MKERRFLELRTGLLVVLRVIRVEFDVGGFDSLRDEVFGELCERFLVMIIGEKVGICGEKVVLRLIGIFI